MQIRCMGRLTLDPESMIRTHCPTCRTPFDVDEGYIGEKGLCPTCGSKFLITRPDSGSSRLDGQTTQPMNATETSSAEPNAPARPTLPAILGLLLGGLFGWGFYYVRTHSLPESLASWKELIAEMHPLFVHFPVAAVILVAMLGVLDARKHHSAIRWMLWINLLACGAGIISGQLFAEDHNEGVVLTRHLWSGIGLAGASMLALVFHILQAKWPYRICIAAAVAGVTLAGHFGAELTHGPLPWPWLEKKEATAVAPASGSPAAAPTPTVAVEERTVYEGVIAPVMVAKCNNCHGGNPAKKPKGDWKSTSVEEMCKSGKGEKPGLVPKNLALSEMVRLMALPDDDDDKMPPPDKATIAAEEVEAIRWWIENGADTTTKLKDAAPEDLKQKLLQIARNPPQPPAAK